MNYNYIVIDADLGNKVIQIVTENNIEYTLLKVGDSVSVNNRIYYVAKIEEKKYLNYIYMFIHVSDLPF